MLGLIYWADSQDDKSIEQLEIAIRENPRDERSRLALSRVLRSAGRDSDAERALQETIRVLPDSALARWWLGSGLERLNQFADARREFELAAAGVIAGRSRSSRRSVGWPAPPPTSRAPSRRSRGRSAQAPTIRRCTSTWPARCCNRTARTRHSWSCVAALLIDPLDAGAHAGIGQIHLNAGRDDEAVTALRRAVELSPNYTEARYALATALMRWGTRKRRRGSSSASSRRSVRCWPTGVATCLSMS